MNKQTTSLSQSQDSDLFFQFNSPIQKNDTSLMDFANNFDSTPGNRHSSFLNGNATNTSPYQFEKRNVKHESAMINRGYNYNYKYTTNNLADVPTISSRLSQQINKMDYKLNSDEHPSSSSGGVDDSGLDPFRDSQQRVGVDDMEEEREVDDEEDDLQLEEEYRQNTYNRNLGNDYVSHGNDNVHNDDLAFSINSASTREVLSNSFHSEMTMEYPPSYKSNNTLDTSQHIISERIRKMSMEDDDVLLAQKKNLHDDMDIFSDEVPSYSSGVYNNNKGDIESESVERNTHNDFEQTPLLGPILAKSRGNHRTQTGATTGKHSKHLKTKKIFFNNNNNTSSSSLSASLISSTSLSTKGFGNNKNLELSRKNQLLHKTKENLNQSRMFSHYNNYLNERFTYTLKDHSDSSSTSQIALSNTNKKIEDHHDGELLLPKKNHTKFGKLEESNKRDNNKINTGTTAATATTNNNSDNFVNNNQNGTTNNDKNWIDAKDMVDAYWIYGKNTVLTEDMFESSSDEE